MKKLLIIAILMLAPVNSHTYDNYKKAYFACKLYKFIVNNYLQSLQIVNYESN